MYAPLNPRRVLIEMTAASVAFIIVFLALLTWALSVPMTESNIGQPAVLATCPPYTDSEYLASDGTLTCSVSSGEQLIFNTATGAWTRYLP